MGCLVNRVGRVRFEAKIRETNLDPIKKSTTATRGILSLQMPSSMQTPITRRVVCSPNVEAVYKLYQPSAWQQLSFVGPPRRISFAEMKRVFVISDIPGY